MGTHSAARWFSVLCHATPWAADELRRGKLDEYSLAREEWHAGLSRTTSKAFAREVREMAKVLAKGALELRVSHGPKEGR